MAKAAIDTRHYDVIVAPHITEKATLLSEHNAVVFKVADKATKRSFDPKAGVGPRAAAFTGR